MARLGASKNKKSPRAADPRQLKKELKRATEQLEARDRELEQRNAELREALEHQTATAEVLGIISRSPTDVQPVLDAIVASAARVCGIDDVVLRLHEGNTMVPRAHFGSVPIPVVEIDIDAATPRWVREHGTLHIPDVREQKVFFVFPEVPVRTFLAVALRLQGEFIGYLGARRTEVRPFTPAQIKLLETFADQAVIALENVRLFQELKESLEQQTATSEILGVIASSPTDIQPVLDVVAATAAKLCEAADAQIRLLESDGTILVASFGSLPAPELIPKVSKLPGTRAMIECRAVHVHDLRAADSEYPGSQEYRCASAQEPFLVSRFYEKELRLAYQYQTDRSSPFFRQTSCSIENLRRSSGDCHRECPAISRTQEALEQQTATSEILGVIASSPTDIQPVLDIIAENAARVCGSYDAPIRLVEEDKLRLAAHYGPLEPGFDLEQPLTHDSVGGRAVLDRELIHIEDLMAVAATKFPEVVSAVERMGGRTILAAPLLREGVAIGVILIRRTRSPTFHRQANQTAGNLCRPSRDRHRERPACSKNSRSAMQNCARRWSIRRQRPRCSASSAARRLTCSRSRRHRRERRPGLWDR